MTRAKEIIDTNQKASAVRRAAQKACAGMRRNHRANRDVYLFTDGSRIVVAGCCVYLQEQPF